MPKFGQHAHRLCAWLGVFDVARYLAASILTAQQLKGRDAPVAARIFSNRFSPDGARIFDQSIGYQGFHRRVLDWLDDEPRGVLVHADVANCYPSIQFEFLAKTLSSAGVESWLVATLRQLLSRWTAEWGGLPVGSNASHILAEGFLTEIDRELQEKGFEFIRYVDDYVAYPVDSGATRYSIRAIQPAA